MPRPSNSNVQTPGTDLVENKPLTETSKLSDPVNVGAKNTVDSPESEADTENVTVSMAEFRALLDNQKALAEQLTLLQAAQRQTAQASAVEEQIARPTVKEVMADKPEVPVLTQEGWYVPESKEWIIARKKD